MSGNRPKSAVQERILLIAQGFRFHEAEERALRLGLEEVLLYVGAPRQGPAGEEDNGEYGKEPRGCVWVGQVSRHPQPYKVEIRVEGEAAPAELEPDAFREDVVRIEVHGLEHEIVQYEPEEEDAVQQYP